MEAILEKKPPKMTGRWSSRLFRLKDRRLMYFKKDVIDFNKAIDSSAKYSLDLTHLISLTIDKKHANVLIIKHPRLDLALRFSTHSLFMSWLKVLSSFSYRNSGQKIETSLPSNYLYSIWNVLQSLYTHPHLTSTEGIFRISANKSEKKEIFHQLLQQTYDVSELRNYKPIHILANVLSALLTNLPSTIFKEKQIESLIEYYDAILNRKPRGIGSKNQMNIFHFDEKNRSQNTAQQHVDDDCKRLSEEIVMKLKDKIESLYLAQREDRNRYGLMTLIFHLLKQVTVHEADTKMTCESLSRIFVDILESKTFLIKLSDPQQMFRMQYLIKSLIYHAYCVFPVQEWQIKDIVIAQKCEIATINLYNECCKLRKKSTKKSMRSHTLQWRQKFRSKHHNNKPITEEENEDNEDNDTMTPGTTPIPTQLKQPSTTKFISHFTKPLTANADEDHKSDDSTIATDEDCGSSDSNSVVRQMIKVRRDSDAIKPKRTAQDEARRRFSRTHKHSRHLSDSVGARGITTIMLNQAGPLDLVQERNNNNDNNEKHTADQEAESEDDDDTKVEPVDVVAFVSHINSWGATGRLATVDPTRINNNNNNNNNNKDLEVATPIEATRSDYSEYYRKKRHTDPPKHYNNNGNNKGNNNANNNNENTVNDTLYNIDPSGVDNDPIPFGHSKNDTIRTDVASFNTFRTLPIAALLHDSNASMSSIDYQSIMDEVDIVITDDEEQEHHTTEKEEKETNATDENEPEIDIRSIKSIASDQWLENMFDEIINEME